MASYKSNCLPKNPSPNYIILGIRTSTYALEVAGVKEGGVGVAGDTQFNPLQEDIKTQKIKMDIHINDNESTDKYC